MADGLNEYRHDPMKWAVDTVLEGNVDIEDRPADDLVESVWDFIIAAFEEESLPLPSKSILTRNVAMRLRSL